MPARTDDPRRAAPPVGGTDETDLPRLRHAIDTLDDRLVELLAQRLDLARRTAPAKARQGLPVQDLAREAEVVRRAADAARSRGLDPEPVRDIFWRLVELGRTAQEAGTDVSPTLPCAERPA